MDLDFPWRVRDFSKFAPFFKLDSWTMLNWPQKTRLGEAKQVMIYLFLENTSILGK